MTYADEPTQPTQPVQSPAGPEQETLMSTWDDESTHPITHREDDPGAAVGGAGRPLRLVPLVLGVIYLGAVLTWGLVQLDLLRAADLDLVLPAVLVVAGGSGLVASVASVRRTSA